MANTSGGVTPTVWWQQCAQPARQAGGRLGDWAITPSAILEVPAIALRPTAAACSGV